jgi:hypothetical protein
MHAVVSNIPRVIKTWQCSCKQEEYWHKPCLDATQTHLKPSLSYYDRRHGACTIMSREVSCSIRMRRQGKSSLAMVRIAAWISILCWSIPDWNLLYWFVFFIGFYGDQAAVVRGPKQPFLMETIRVDPPRKMEVRIKILYTSICHTDLSAWKGEVT